MPKYLVTDDQGKSFHLDWDGSAPPTSDDMAAIFASAQANVPTSGQPDPQLGEARISDTPSGLPTPFAAGAMPTAEAVPIDEQIGSRAAIGAMQPFQQILDNLNNASQQNAQGQYVQQNVSNLKAILGTLSLPLTVPTSALAGAFPDARVNLGDLLLGNAPALDTVMQGGLFGQPQSPVDMRDKGVGAAFREGGRIWLNNLGSPEMLGLVLGSRFVPGMAGRVANTGFVGDMALNAAEQSGQLAQDVYNRQYSAAAQRVPGIMGDLYFVHGGVKHSRQADAAIEAQRQAQMGYAAQYQTALDNWRARMAQGPFTPLETGGTRSVASADSRPLTADSLPADPLAVRLIEAQLPAEGLADLQQARQENGWTDAEYADAVARAHEALTRNEPPPVPTQPADQETAQNASGTLPSGTENVAQAGAGRPSIAELRPDGVILEGKRYIRDEGGQWWRVNQEWKQNPQTGATELVETDRTAIGKLRKYQGEPLRDVLTRLALKQASGNLRYGEGSFTTATEARVIETPEQKTAREAEAARIAEEAKSRSSQNVIRLAAKQTGEQKVAGATSLLDMIIARGGIAMERPDGQPTDRAAEIRDILDKGGNETWKQKRTMRRLIDNNNSAKNAPDYLLEAAVEGGWLPEGSGLDDLTEAIRQELTGEAYRYHEGDADRIAEAHAERANEQPLPTRVATVADAHAGGEQLTDPAKRRIYDERGRSWTVKQNPDGTFDARLERGQSTARGESPVHKGLDAGAKIEILDTKATAPREPGADEHLLEEQSAVSGQPSGENVFSGIEIPFSRELDNHPLVGEIKADEKAPRQVTRYRAGTGLPTSTAARWASDHLSRALDAERSRNNAKPLHGQSYAPAAFNPADAHVRVVDAVARALGLHAIWVERVNPRADAISGARLSGTNIIVLNVDGGNPLLSTVAHEAAHALKEINPRAWNEFVRVLMQEADPAKVNNWLARFNDNMPQGTRAEARVIPEEFIADVLGDAATEPQFWRGLMEKAPRPVRQFLHVLLDVLDRSLKAVNERWALRRKASDAIEDMARVRDAAAEALASMGKTEAAQPRSQGVIVDEQGQVRFSREDKALDEVTGKDTAALARRRRRALGVGIEQMDETMQRVSRLLDAGTIAPWRARQLAAAHVRGVDIRPTLGVLSGSETQVSSAVPARAGEIAQRAADRPLSGAGREDARGTQSFDRDAGPGRLSADSGGYFDDLRQRLANPGRQTEEWLGREVELHRQPRPTPGYFTQRRPFTGSKETAYVEQRARYAAETLDDIRHQLDDAVAWTGKDGIRHQGIVAGIGASAGEPLAYHVLERDLAGKYHLWSNFPARKLEAVREALSPQLSALSEASFSRDRAIPQDAGEVLSAKSFSELRAHPRYREAKAGDRAAALDVARDLVSDDLAAEAVRRWGKDVVIVPVNAVEAGGKNWLPMGIANVLAQKMGVETAGGIYQKNVVQRTGKGAMERMVRQPEFAGDVVKGQRYVLVDDVVHLGGTQAALADHLQKNGGVVAGIFSLANESRVRNLAIDERTANQLETRFGDALRKELGIEPRAVTAPEAQRFLSLSNVDRLRAEISRARGTRGIGMDEATTGQREVTPPAPSAQFSRDAEGESLTNKGAKSLAKRVDLTKVKQEGDWYEVVPHGDRDPLGYGGDKFYLSPENRWVSVQEHEDAARELLGSNAHKGRTSETNPNQAILEGQHGFVRVIDDGQVLYFSPHPGREVAASQIRELKDVAIEYGKRLVMDKMPTGEQTLYDPAAEGGVKLSRERESGIRFSVDEKPAERNLVAVHNLSADKLRHALKMGGLPMPSLAIIRSDRSVFDKYGDITLVAPRGLVDPKTGVRVFNADGYTPRYPSVKVTLGEADTKRLAKELMPLAGDDKNLPASYRYSMDSLWSEIRDEGLPRALRSSPLVWLKYAHETGKLPADFEKSKGYAAEEILRKAQSEEGFEPWVGQFVERMQFNPKEEIFTGFTPSGNRRYVKHTLETVVRLMKRDMAKGEGFNYGTGSVRSKAAKQYRSLEGIQSDREQVIPSAEFELVKKNMDSELIALADRIMPLRASHVSGFGRLEAFADDLVALASGDRKWIREMYGDNPDAVPQMQAFLEKLKRLPTEYFEAKQQRAVRVNEFEAAVLPHDADTALAEQLQQNGLRVVRYQRGNEADRQRAINDAGQSVKFSREREHKFGKRWLESDEVGKQAKKLGDDVTYQGISRLQTQSEAETWLHQAGTVDQALGKLFNTANGIEPRIRVAALAALERRFNDEERAARLGRDKAGADALARQQVEIRRWMDDVGAELGRGVDIFKAWGNDIANLTPAGWQIYVEKKIADARLEKMGSARAAAHSAAIRELGEASAEAAPEAAKKVAKDKGTGRTLWQEYQRGIAGKMLTTIRSTLAPDVADNVRAPLEEFTARITGAFRDAVKRQLSVVSDQSSVGKQKTEGLKTDNFAQLVAQIRDAVVNPDRWAEAHKTAADAIRNKYANRPEILDALDKFLNNPDAVPIDRKLLGDVVREQVGIEAATSAHYDGGTRAVASSLADKIVQAAGLTGEHAQAVADQIRAAVAEATATRKRAVLNRLIAQTPRFRGRAKLRSVADRILEASNVGALDNEKYWGIVAPKLGLPKFTPEFADEVRRRAEEIQAIPEGAERQEAITHLLSRAAAEHGISAKELGWGYWYSSVLSGYGTQLVNLVDTQLNVLSNAATEAQATPSAIGKIVGGLMYGARRGAVDALGVLQTGVVTGTRMLKSEAHRAVELKAMESPWYHWTQPAKYVGRAMSAADMFNFRMAEEMESRLLAADRGVDATVRPADMEAARSQAEAEGLTGWRARRRAYEIIQQQHPADIVEAAADYGRKSTYNHDPEGFAGAVSNAINYVTRDYSAARFIVPFTKISANVFNSSLDWTPVGAIRAYRGTGGDAAAPTGRARRVALIKAAEGTALLAGLAAMALKYHDDEDPPFWIYGWGPNDPTLRRQMMSQGWQPNSFKIGNRFYSYRFIRPITIPMTIVGNYLDGVRFNKLDQKSLEDKLAASLTGVADLMLSQTYMQGVRDFLDMLQQGKGSARMKGFVASPINALVPRAVQDIERAFHPERSTATTTGEYLTRDMPVAREMFNQPMLDSLGRPVRYRTSPLARFVSTRSEDQLDQLLATRQLRVPAVGTATTVGWGINRRRVTPQELYELRRDAGTQMRQWLQQNQPLLATMTRDQAQRMIDNAANAFHAQARNMLRSRLAQPVEMGN